MAAEIITKEDLQEFGNNLYKSKAQFIIFAFP
jgi:hypothetical protein